MSDNVVRVTNQRSQRVYITYVIRTLEGGPDAQGNESPKQDEVTIRGMGRAIFNAVNIAEIIKRRVAGLHQITTITSETMQDSTREDRDGKERKVSVIMIRLSKKPLDTSNVGYQAPLPADQVVAQEPERPRAPRGDRGGRGGARGGRGAPRGGRGGEGSREVRRDEPRREGRRDEGPRARGGRGRRDDEERPRGGRGGGYRGERRRDDGADYAPRGGARGGSRGGPRGGSRGGLRGGRPPRGGRA